MHLEDKIHWHAPSCVYIVCALTMEHLQISTSVKTRFIHQMNAAFHVFIAAVRAACVCIA